MQITLDVPDNTLMINLEYTYRRESGSTSNAHVFAEDIMSGKMLKATPRNKNVEQIKGCRENED